MGAELYIYQDAGGNPDGNPTAGNVFVNLTNIQLNAGLELLTDEAGSTIFQIKVTAANGGTSITLPAGSYWVAFAPFVQGGSNGAGRWNWNGSSITPANQPVLIDPGNYFGVGATDWTNISSLIGQDLPSLAWTLTSVESPTGDARISEVDADQTATDTEEFVEIQTEFANQSLNGMIAVFYDGFSGTSYTTVNLHGFTSDDNGYFLIGTDAVAGADITLGADNKIQNGADAVALYIADEANFPNGTPVTTDGLVDAVVYGTSDDDDTGLLTGLGQTTQWDENENGAKDTESLQWDDATQGFCAGVPTPKAANSPCQAPPPPGSDIIVRPSSNTSNVISTHGNDDLGVYCADFFTLVEPIVLGDFTFDGATFNGPIASLLLGAELYIYQDAGGNPDGNPTAGNVFVNLTNIQLNAGLELLTDEASSNIFQINVTAANGGTPITLPAGSYWIAFAPFVQGGSNGAGRWNWNGSSITPANQPVLIDPGNLFGAGATDWTNISSLIGQDLPSLAWTLTGEEPTTPCQSTPAITDPITDYFVCDLDGNGIETFDLTSKDQEILNTLVDVTLSYHLSLADAESGSSPIPIPTTYQNLSNPQAIWIRAIDDTTSNPVCYSVGVFDLIVEPTPDFSPIPAITSADDEVLDGLTEFDLNSYIPEITLGNPDLTVTFHENFDNAQNGVQNLPGLYTNLSNPQTIYARVSDNNTGCYGIFAIDLFVILPPPNNLCENASALSCGMSVEGLDTSFATNTNAPDACGTALDTAPGVWHTLTIPTDGDYNVSVDTFGSVFDTKLGVFSGNCNDLICIGGNDDSGGTAQSKVLFTGAAAQTYYIYVTGFNTSSGEYDINISCVLIPPLPPGNDLCENAVLIECGSQSQGDTSFATNTNAPSACETDLDTAPGVWYTLPLPTDGDYNVSVDTFGSGFDTKLGVFSGNCNELVCIGGNDDFGGTAQSKVLFTGDGAQTYYIYVTGFGTSSGDYTLNIACEDVLDITENDFVDINIYPNPASDKVTISNPGLLELETISVYDLKGRLMIKNNMEGIESITIDTSILQSATYMIVIESKYRYIVKRLLIE